MTVIRDEYISDNITMHDVLPLGFLKKSRYTGEKGNMRFLMEKAEVSAEELSRVCDAASASGSPSESLPTGEGTESKEDAPEPEKFTKLRCCVWPEPFSFDHTEDKVKTYNYFEFSSEGIEEAVKWLNEKMKDFSEAKG